MHIAHKVENILFHAHFILLGDWFLRHVVYVQNFDNILINLIEDLVSLLNKLSNWSIKILGFRVFGTT